MFSKVALITGGARRIGAQIAETLHQNGYRVIVHYRHSKSEAMHLVEQLNKKQSDSAFAIYGDLADTAALPVIIEQAMQFAGRLDLLVNNASSFYPTPMGEITEQQWDELQASNVKAAFFLAQAAYPFLQKHQGNIINIIDIHAETAMRHYSVYCIAKAGLLMATKSLAKEMAPNVRVNGISPGAIIWPEGMNALDNVMQEKLLNKIPLNQHGHPKDIANAVLFLAGQSYITGEVINVDGGRHLNM